MNNKMICVAVLLGLNSYAYADLTTNEEIQDGCSKVKQYAQLGKKHYDQKQYSKALNQFKDQAAWTSFCLLNDEVSGIKLSERDIEIANNNVGLSYAKLNKPQWAKAWFLRDEDTKSSQFNLSKLPVPKASNDLSGTYVSRSGFGQWDTIHVKKNKNKYEIDYEGYYFGVYGLIYGPNMGEFGTSMSSSAKKATYVYEDCKINLNFAFNTKLGQHIQVSENTGEGGCGFGRNVSAGGTYIKVENLK